MCAFWEEGEYRSQEKVKERDRSEYCTSKKRRGFLRPLQSDQDIGCFGYVRTKRKGREKKKKGKRRTAGASGKRKRGTALLICAVRKRKSDLLLLLKKEAVGKRERGRTLRHQRAVSSRKRPATPARLKKSVVLTASASRKG